MIFITVSPLLLCIAAECALSAWPYLARLIAHH